MKEVDAIAWDGICPRCGKSTTTHKINADRVFYWDVCFYDNNRVMRTHRFRTPADAIQYASHLLNVQAHFFITITKVMEPL